MLQSLLTYFITRLKLLLWRWSWHLYPPGGDRVPTLVRGQALLAATWTFLQHFRFSIQEADERRLLLKKLRIYLILFFIAQAHKQQMVLFPIFVKLDKKKKSIYFHIIWRGRWWWGGGGFLFCQVEKSGFNKGLLPARVWRFHSATAVSVSVSALVALSLPKGKLSGGPAVAFCRCHSLFKIDELIVGLLPVCLCPGRRCPGYGWESQLWHPPCGYYCNRPTGDLGGCWPPEQPWPTYCCHTPGDTVARAPTRGSDWLR